MVRSNSDLVITWRLLKFDERKSMAEDYLSIENAPTKSKSLKMGYDIMDAIAQTKYQALVICVYRSSYATTTSDYVTWYLAKDKVKVAPIGDKGFRSRRTMQKEMCITDKDCKNKKLNVRVKFDKYKNERLRIGK